MKSWFWFIVNLHAILSVSSVGEFKSLLLRKNEDTFELANPIQYVEKEDAYIMSFGKDIDFYYACSHTTSLMKKMLNLFLNTNKILWPVEYTDADIVYDTFPFCDEKVESVTWPEMDSEDDLTQTYVVGFQVKIEEQEELLKLPLFKLFVDVVLQQTFAVQHVLEHIISPHSLSIDKISFKHDLGTKFYQKFFSRNDQVKFFKSFHYGEEFTNLISKDHLVKKNLMPDKDLLLEVWKEAVYRDSNTAPMWRTLVEKWKQVENLCRIVAEKYESLTITTGISGILDLPKSNGEKISFNSTRIRIPQFWWKAVEIDFEDEIFGIIIVMRNNPFEKYSPAEIDLCESNGWKLPKELYKSGLIFCYEMNDANIIGNLRAGYALNTRKLLNLNYFNERLQLISENQRNSNKLA